MEYIKRKILFLDRDGTICYDDGAFGSEKYSYDEVIKRIRPIEGVCESLKYAKSLDYLLILISNQAGIAKGRFDEYHTHLSNRLLNDKLDNIIDGFYYCPHHETGKNNNGTVSNNAKTNLIYECDCRKPKIGMFKECENDLKNGMIKYIDDRIIDNRISYEQDRDSIKKIKIDNIIIDKENSYMIGDKWIDIKAGNNFGVNSIFVMTGEGEVEYKSKREKFVREYGDLPKNFKICDNINEFIYKELK